MSFVQLVTLEDTLRTKAEEFAVRNKIRNNQFDPVVVPRANSNAWYLRLITAFKAELMVVVNDEIKPSWLHAEATAMVEDIVAEYVLSVSYLRNNFAGVWFPRINQ